MLAAHNQKCLLCGKPIEGCSCVSGWKNIACCPEHYIQYMEKEEANVKSKTLFRIQDINGKTDDIIDYNIKKNKYVSLTKTYKKEDILCFLIPAKNIDELISTYIENNNLDSVATSKNP